MLKHYHMTFYALNVINICRCFIHVSLLSNLRWSDMMHIYLVAFLIGINLLYQHMLTKYFSMQTFRTKTPCYIINLIGFVTILSLYLFEMPNWKYVSCSCYLYIQWYTPSSTTTTTTKCLTSRNFIEGCSNFIAEVIWTKTTDDFLATFYILVYNIYFILKQRETTVTILVGAFR